MSDSQRASAVKRKRAVAQGVGGKPTNVKTFAKRTKKADGGDAMVRQAQKNYIGSYVSGDLGGVKVGINLTQNIILTLVSECQKYHNENSRQNAGEK